MPLSEVLLFRLSGLMYDYVFKRGSTVQTFRTYILVCI